MSGNFNMKEWMHQNGQGPYKLHENYIDLKALGSLKEKDEEEIEADQKKPGKPDQEEKPGRPPHATSIKPWWEKEIDDEEERMSNKYTKNYDDEESGASLEEADREGMLDFKHAGNIGKVPVMVATGDSGTEYEIIGPHKDGTYRAFIGDDQIDDTYDNIYKLKAYLNSIEAGKSTIEEQEDEDIPYAEEIPDEEDGVYEMGKKLYDQTQEILNTKGAKVVNSLTLLQVASNVGEYKALLGKLKTFKDKLSSGLDTIYDYVEAEKEYDSKDPKVKELEKMHKALDNDLEVLGDIIEILDSMVFLVRNGWKEKGLTLGKTDVASNDKGLPLGEI